MKFDDGGVFVDDHGPAPQGAGGLKYLFYIVAYCINCPAPQGAGGLKFIDVKSLRRQKKSRPARGGWIEIYAACLHDRDVGVPPRKGRVD